MRRRQDANNLRRRVSRRKNWRRGVLLMELALVLVLLMAVRDIIHPTAGEIDKIKYLDTKVSAGAEAYDYSGAELEEFLELNEELLDYVTEYPNREKYKEQSVDLTEDFKSGEVPLLMQWDKRWGYDSYGDNMIGIAGCGPVCLTMAYLYFTEDTSISPREMAAFAYDNGYYTEAGSSWSLWTEGVEKLGLKGEELSLDEHVMCRALDAGGLIVCSMRPGDFTTTGHFILIRGYDENGFYVNDPNRRSNSERQWDYDTLRGQIKNLWKIQLLFTAWGNRA